MRSRTPPCPGSREPESLTPAERLSADSARSPTWAATLTTTARYSQYHQTSPEEESRQPTFHIGICISCARPSRTRVDSRLPPTEASVPSQVLLGLSVGASLCRPQARPT